MKNIFYHDGCSVCSDTGKVVITLLGLSNMDIIHIGLHPKKEIEAKSFRVKTFPALVTTNGNVLHLNVFEHEGSVECLLK
jgi:glutaredoxin 3